MLSITMANIYQALFMCVLVEALTLVAGICYFLPPIAKGWPGGYWEQLFSNFTFLNFAFQPYWQG